MLRGVAQVVAHLTGGQGVASSSLVTPTKIQGILLDTLYFALLRKVELAMSFSKSLIWQETVRWTVSQNDGFNCVVIINPVLGAT